MDIRDKYFSELNSFVEGIDKEVTMILQSLQWDRKHLLEGNTMVTCKYDSNHRIPSDLRESHEKDCFLFCHGYSKEITLLPDPVDVNARTLVKLSNEDITQIMNTASNFNPSFKKVYKYVLYMALTMGPFHFGPPPLSADRLQATYTADERRAIHDAVVNAVPSCHDLTDLALPSTNEEEKNSKVKSRAEILAELRDMKRRRAKYRVAAKTRNYSDVLRDVIKTQMEHYTEARTEQRGQTIKQEMNYSDNYKKLNISRIKHISCEVDNDKDKHRKEIKINVSREVKREETNDELRGRSYSKNKERHNDTYRKSDHSTYPSTSTDRSRYNNRSKNEKNYRDDRSSHSEKSNSLKDRSRRKEEDRHYKERHSDYYSIERTKEEKYKRYYDGSKREASDDDRRKRKKYS